MNAGLGCRCDRANGCRVVERLADAPGATLLFHLVLQVAPRHVQAHGVAEDVLERIIRLDVLAAGANGHDEFDLMVEVSGQAGVGQGARLARVDHHDGVSRFEKEERRLTAGESHLLGMLFIIAAHAVNTVHGKPCVGALDGNRNDG